MKSDWQSQEVVEAWSAANGSRAFPFGDEWRMALVNPVALEVARRMASELASISESPETVWDGHNSSEAVPLDLGLLIQREHSGANDSETLLNWHMSLIKEPDYRNCLDPLTVLDLGCGEGYLGRWLCKLGARYIGVDVSAGMVAEANQRAERKPRKQQSAKKTRQGRATCGELDRLQFSDLDLEGAMFAENRSRLDNLVESFGRPHLVVMNILLEHLEDPQPILNWIGERLSTYPRPTKLLLFTLNPDYFYESIKKPGTQKHKGEGVTRLRARIASANTEVAVFLRSTKRVEQLLRDNRLQLHQYAPLHFPFGFSPSCEERKVAGIAPFQVFLAGALPRAEEVEDVNTILKELASSGPCLLSSLTEIEARFLLRHGKDLDIVNFAPGETVFPQHNMGGDVVAVCQGSLELKDGGETLQEFGEGELVGDLETSIAGHAAYYIYSVKASRQGARLLRIPARIISELVSLQPSFGGSLFHGLRDRLVIANWVYNSRGRVAPSVNHGRDSASRFGEGIERVPIKKLRFKMKGSDADRIARILLGAAEAERQSAKRAPEGNMVLLSFEDLHRRTGLNLKSPWHLGHVLSLMTHLSIADGFPGSSLRSHRDVKPQYEKHWRDIVADATAAYLISFLDESTDAKHGMDTLSHVVQDYRLSAGAQWRSHKGWAKDIRDLKTEIDGRYRGKRQQAWQMAVHNWLQYLCRVNQFWYDQMPAFFYLQDSRMLRRLALDHEGELVSSFAARFRALQVPEDVEDKGYRNIGDLTQEIIAKQPGRVELYIEKVTEFFRADLHALSGSLNFSGHIHGYDVPEWED